MRRIVFAGERIVELPKGLRCGNDYTFVGWHEWHHPNLLHSIDCWRMRIPYARIAQEVRKMKKFRRVFVMADPWVYLRATLSHWYRAGESPKAFAFYREFRRMTDEIGLETPVALRLFRERLEAYNPVPLRNPQLALLDLSKRPDKAYRALKHFDRIVTIDALDPEGGKPTPFDRIELEEYDSLFAPWIEKDLELYRVCREGLSEKRSRKRREKKKESKKNRGAESPGGIVTRIDGRTLKGWLSFDRKPEKEYRVVVKRNGKVLSRQKLDTATLRSLADGRYRLPFRFEGLKLDPSHRIEVMVAPGRKALKLGKKAREFFAAGKKKKRPSTRTEEASKNAVKEEESSS